MFFFFLRIFLYLFFLLVCLFDCCFGVEDFVDSFLNFCSFFSLFSRRFADYGKLFLYSLRVVDSTCINLIRYLFSFTIKHAVLYLSF